MTSSQHLEEPELKIMVYQKVYLEIPDFCSNSALCLFSRAQDALSSSHRLLNSTPTFFSADQAYLLLWGESLSPPPFFLSRT